jgi:cytidylate kinase
VTAPVRRREGAVVAIDGPAGVGKSTAARLVAQRLGYTLVDTGALYRAVALVAAERGVDLADGPAVAALASALAIELGQGPDGRTRLVVDGRDRSADIRRNDISMAASTASKHAEVRAALLDLQRQLGREGGVVLEGRDIGTVVFPDAEVKVFLTARPEVRARRRYDELAARGELVAFDEILADVRRRDHQDETRAVAPLRPADDAVIVDSSELDAEGVVSRVLEVVRCRAGDDSL